MKTTAPDLAAAAGYDPFTRGPHPAGVRTSQVADPARGRLFPLELWYPAVRGWGSPGTGLPGTGLPGTGGAPEPAEWRDAAARPGPAPLVIYSHFSGGHRRSASFVCAHLASHGYIVAALDHSELVTPELASRPDETAERRAARIEAIIASRVPDIRLLLDHLQDEQAAAVSLDGARPEAGAAGVIGHSLGGWTALAAPETEPRVRAVVAMGPGGSARRPLPGVLPLALSFAWPAPVPVLYLAADQDVPIPLEAVAELHGRTPRPRQLLVLREADHYHFCDDVVAAHEEVRGMTLPGEAGWIPAAMRPATELCSQEQAHLFVRGLTLSHLDAALRGREAAARFLAGDVVAALAARGVAASSVA